MFTSLSKRLAATPGRIFVIDGIGACLTALLLLLLIRTNVAFFGVQPDHAVFLAAIAGVFAIYSLLCAFLVKTYRNDLLRIILSANVLYCALTASMLCCLSEQMTAWGKAYFIGEIVLILQLVYLEYRTLQERANRS